MTFDLNKLPRGYIYEIRRFDFGDKPCDTIIIRMGINGDYMAQLNADGGGSVIWSVLGDDGPVDIDLKSLYKFVNLIKQTFCEEANDVCSERQNEQESSQET